MTQRQDTRQRLVTTLNEQFAESAKLETTIRANLRQLGYDEIGSHT